MSSATATETASSTPTAPITTPSKPFIKRSKDLSEVKQVCPYLPFSQISKKLLGPEPITSPIDCGTISLLVERPGLNKRKIVTSTRLTHAGGMEGSGWEFNPERGPVDQICVMSTAAIREITGSEDPDIWAEAGDQIFMDYELGDHHLQIGDFVQVGPKDRGVLLQVSPKAHTGCGKFARRYGSDALKVVANKLARERRLRGIYFVVVKDGVIETGDDIVKVLSEDAQEMTQ